MSGGSSINPYQACYGISEAEFKVIQAQQARRAEMRAQFLKMRTDPFKHAAESGYVFDPALQRYHSMKTSQYERFKPNVKNAMFGIFVMIVPMVAYGYLIWNDRAQKEAKMRAGEVLYRDRTFKFQ